MCCIAKLSDWRNVSVCVCMSAGRRSGHHFLCLYAGLPHCSLAMTSSPAGSTHTLTASSWEPVQGVLHIHVKVCMHLTIYVCLLASEGQMGAITSSVCARASGKRSPRTGSEEDGVQSEREDCLFHFTFKLKYSPICSQSRTPIHTHTHTQVSPFSLMCSVIRRPCIPICVRTLPSSPEDIAGE